MSFTGKKQGTRERDESGDVTSRRQRELTLTSQPDESQDGTTITVGLPIGTPERPRAPSALQAPLPLPPSSTAPPTLGDSLGKRKRRITDKYKEGRQQGDVPFNQALATQLNTTLVDGDEF